MQTGIPEYDAKKGRVIDRFHGKTARWEPYIHQPECTVERDSFFKNNGCNDMSVALTEIDDLFPSLYDGGKISLRRNKLWETVTEKLKAAAVDSPHRQYDPHTKKHTFVYSIPISKYALMPSIPHNIKHFGGVNRFNSDNKKWLYWKGKYYDPGFIYHVSMDAHGNCKLNKVCPTKQKPHQFLLGDSRIKALDGAISILGKPTKQLMDTVNCKNLNCNFGSYYKIQPRNFELFRHIRTPYINSTTLYNNMEVTKTVENSLNNGIVINFHKVACITHIGVRSQTAEVINFPKGFHGLHSSTNQKITLEKAKDRNDSDTTAINELKMNLIQQRNRFRKTHRRRARKGTSNRNGFVYVLRQLGQNGLGSIPYVTTFDLHYKKPGHGGWCLAAANIQIEISNNALSESCIDLKAVDAFNCKEGLVAKEIKLIPTNWHIKPTYMVRCYGITNIDKKVENISKEDSIEGTVQYIVTERISDNWQFDCGRKRDDWYYYDSNARKSKDRLLQEAMREKD